MTKQKRAASSTARKRRAALVDFAVGMGLIAAVLLAKAAFETSNLGKLLDGALYSWVQTRLADSGDGPTTVVIDMSKLDDDSSSKLSARSRLVRLIDLIAKQKPAAIGIDIDFSPDSERWSDRGGPQFFEYLLGRHGRDKGVPIYLGVSRLRYGNTAEWLGSDAYADFAANILLPVRDNQRMPLWIRLGKPEGCGHLVAGLLRTNGPQDRSASCLPSMSVVLARHYGLVRPRPIVRWPSSLLRVSYEDELDAKNERYAGYFFPNYGITQSLIDRTCHAALIGGQVQLDVNPQVLGGKVVLVGNAAWNAPDKQSIPPWQHAEAGVYFHAAATASLIAGSLLEVTSGARLSLDFLIAFAIVAAVTLLRYSYAPERGHEIAAGRLHVLLAVCAVAAVLLVSYGLVRYTRILWVDAMFVSAGLIAHSLIEPVAEQVVHWIDANWRALWRGLIFK